MRVSRWEWLHPGREEGGFAKACLGGNQCEGTPPTFVQPGEEARTSNHGVGGHRHEEFGGQQVVLPPHLAVCLVLRLLLLRVGASDTWPHAKAPCLGGGEGLRLGSLSPSRSELL